MLFPYHSSVVQVHPYVSASGALFSFLSGASEIISLCLRSVKGFFTSFGITRENFSLCSFLEPSPGLQFAEPDLLTLPGCVLVEKGKVFLIKLSESGAGPGFSMKKMIASTAAPMPSTIFSRIVEAKEALQA